MFSLAKSLNMTLCCELITFLTQFMCNNMAYFRASSSEGHSREGGTYLCLWRLLRPFPTP